MAGGCGGRAISKKSARSAIIGSPAAVLEKNDVEVLSITSAGADEAIAETRLNAAFRLVRKDGDWVVREIRLGKGQWERIDDVVRAVEQIKMEQTRELLAKVAAAIDAYRQKSGRLPDFKDYVSLTDSLHPQFMTPLIREDAWAHPLAAVRQSPSTILLISAGPDGKPGTPDDITLTRTY
jgi:hypothetical protein